MGDNAATPLPFRQKLAGMSFVVVTGTLPVLALFNNRAIVPVCAVLAAIVFFAWGPSKVWDFLKALSTWTKILVGGFFVWAALSIFWAPDMSQSARTLVKITGTGFLALALIGPAAFLFNGYARKILWVAFISLVSVSCLLLVDIYTGGIFSKNVLGKGIYAPYGAFWLKPAASLLAITIWPIAAFLWRDQRRYLAGFVIILSIAVLHAISVNTGLIATILGMAIAICFLAMGSRRSWIAIAVLSMVYLATPIIAGSVLQPKEITSELSLVSPAQNSIAYRLHIWHFAANAIFDKPATGWGLNSSRFIGSDEVVSDAVRGEIGEAIPLHPHNAVLQIFLELGIVGAVLVLALLGRVLLRLGADGWPPSDRVFAIGMFAAILLFYSASFSAWSSWWNAYLCYAVALFNVARQSHIEVE